MHPPGSALACLPALRPWRCPARGPAGLGAQAGVSSLALANAVHLLAAIAKLVAESAAASALVALFEGGPSLPAGAEGGGRW